MLDLEIYVGFGIDICVGGIWNCDECGFEPINMLHLEFIDILVGFRKGDLNLSILVGFRSDIYAGFGIDIYVGWIWNWDE